MKQIQEVQMWRHMRLAELQATRVFKGGSQEDRQPEQEKMGDSGFGLSVCSAKR